MLRAIVLLVLLVQLQALTVNHEFPSCREVDYSFSVLVLTWPEQFCSETRCRWNWENYWNDNGMTIHGYWPSSTDLAYLDCFKKHHGVDPYCTDELRFDSDLFTSDELSEIEEYWPSFKGGSFESFVSYEYKKHGTCYVHLIEEEGSALPAEQIQREYILGVVDKVKELDIQLSRQKVYSKGKLADLLGLEESQFLAICKWDNELDEVRICYSVASTPGDQEIIDCPPSTDRSQCRFPMWIK